MRSRSRKVKMLSKCYTFLAFTACTILFTSKDVKAVVGGLASNVGKMGPRVRTLARNFGEVVGEGINYGSISSQGTGGGKLPKPTTGPIGSGTLLNLSSGKIKTLSSGNTSVLLSIKLRASDLGRKQRNINKILIANKKDKAVPSTQAPVVNPMKYRVFSNDSYKKILDLIERNSKILEDSLNNKS